MAKVFKKTSKSEAITLFLATRDYVDHVDKVDNIDGVLRLDTKNFGVKKVFVTLACAFRYGSEDLDVMGLSFRKDIWIKRFQVYPAGSHKPDLSPIHQTLIKKAGGDAVPFRFELPPNLPCSVTLDPGTGDKRKACGVDFEVKAYLAMEADNPDEKIEKKNRARLIVRKIQFAPSQVGPGPKGDICKSFMMSDKPCHLEISMDKDLFYHGEPITVHIKVRNESNKQISKINVAVDQQADVVLYSSDKYNKCVHSQDFAETINAESNFETSVKITPLLANVPEQRGLAVDGRLKDDDTNLASTTILASGVDQNVMGILVTYKVKVNLMVAGGGLLGGLMASDVTAEIPLKLMHPKPKEVVLE